MSSQTHERFAPQTPWISWCVLLLGMTAAGCHGYLEFEGQTHAVTVPALPEAECPAGWTGDTLPGSLADHLNQALTSVFVEIGEQADSEIARRNAGITDAVRVTSLSLQMTDPRDGTDMQSSFGFLAGVEIYAESSRVGSTLPRVLIAWNASIPGSATTLPLQMQKEVDLHPYLSEGLRITADVMARSCLRRNVTFRASYIGLVRPTH